MDAAAVAAAIALAIGQLPAPAAPVVDQAAIDAAVAAAINLAMQGQAGQVPAAAGVPAVQQPLAGAVFALNPGGAGNLPWDVTEGSGRKTYKDSTEGIAPKYGGDKLELRNFLREVYDRAKQFGWKDIMHVVTAAESMDISLKFGMLTRVQVVAHAMAYLGLQSRLAQGDGFLATLIGPQG